MFNLLIYCPVSSDPDFTCIWIQIHALSAPLTDGSPIDVKWDGSQSPSNQKEIRVLKERNRRGN